MMKKMMILILALLLMSQSVFARDISEYRQRFWDVAKEHWAFLYIADLAERGVLNGYEDGSFKPSRTVTRAEWAKIMVDAAGVSVADNSVYYTDMSNHWANKYVNAARNYLTGYTDGSYRPDQAATREDVTVAMVRIKGYDLSEVDYSYLSDFKDVDSISNYAKGYVAVAVQNNLISGFEDNTFRGQATLTRAEAATLLYRAFQHGNADKVVAAPEEPIKQNSVSIKEDKPNEEYIQQSYPVYEEPVEEEIEVVEEETKSYTYTIDTMAEVSAMVTSMVTDNKNVLHYVVNDKVYNTNGDKLNMDNLTYEGPYDYSVDLVHLAYDEYNDILYLIANDCSDRLVIFDITDYDNPKAIMNKFNAKKIDDLSVSLSYPYGGATMRRVEVLKNGSLLLSSVESDMLNVHEYSKHDYKLMVNLESMSFSRYEKIYSIPEQIYISPLNRDIGNDIVRRNDQYYFWNAQGYAMIDKQGKYHVLAGIKDIESLDYKTVGKFNIWNTTVDNEDSFIFYDNTDMCIRILKKR